MAHPTSAGLLAAVVLKLIDPLAGRTEEAAAELPGSLLAPLVSKLLHAHQDRLSSLESLPYLESTTAQLMAREQQLQAELSDRLQALATVRSLPCLTGKHILDNNTVEHAYFYSFSHRFTLSHPFTAQGLFHHDSVA